MTQRTFSVIEHGSEAYEQSLALRDEVLRKPLGLQFSDEELAREAEYHHLVCVEDGKVLGCVVLVPLENKTIRMRQVVVEPHFQSQGIGRALVKIAEAFAREQDYKTMTLNARDTAKSFYDKLDYQTIGEPFVEVTVLHWHMQKTL